MDVGEQGTLLDAGAALDVADDADRVVDLVLLRPPSGAEVERGHPDSDRAQSRDRARTGSVHRQDERCLRQRGRVGVAALSPDPALVDVQRRAVRDRGLGGPPPFLDVEAEVGERQQPGARIENELREVRWPFAAHRVARLGDLQGVADRRSERLIHVGEQADDLATGVPPELEHRLGEGAGVVERLHERAVADLHVEHDRVGAARDLLRHDRGRDQRQDVHRRGHVSERVELLVRRDEVIGLADDREADRLHLGDELVDGELDVEAGDRLELVERPAGVAETPPAHLSHRHAAGGDDRADGDRRLVADAAGRVLVDDLPSERCAEVERAAAPDHRVGERVRLGGGHALEVDGHAERGQLVVGDLAAGVAEDQLRDLLRRELLAVPLPLDQLGRADHDLPATKTQWVERVWNGSVSSGTRSARCERVVVAATKSTIEPDRGRRPCRSPRAARSA